MGVGQAIALQPGVSRSGVSMTFGRMAGLGRDGAARFAFLMSLPITAGALVFKWVDVSSEGGIPDGFVAAVRVGHRRQRDHRVAGGVGHAQAREDPLVHAVRDLPDRPRRAACCCSTPSAESARRQRQGHGAGTEGDRQPRRGVGGHRDRDGGVADVDHRARRWRARSRAARRRPPPAPAPRARRPGRRAPAAAPCPARPGSPSRACPAGRRAATAEARPGPAAPRGPPRPAYTGSASRTSSGSAVQRAVGHQRARVGWSTRVLPASSRSPAARSSVATSTGTALAPGGGGVLGPLHARSSRRAPHSTATADDQRPALARAPAQGQRHVEAVRHGRPAHGRASSRIEADQPGEAAADASGGPARLGRGSRGSVELVLGLSALAGAARAGACEAASGLLVARRVLAVAARAVVARARPGVAALAGAADGAPSTCPGCRSCRSRCP